MPCVGSSRIRTLGLVESHLANATFCRLPPERVRDELVDACRVAHRRSVWRRTRRYAAPPRRRHPNRASLIDDRQGDVVNDRSRHDEADAVAVFGQIGEPEPKHLFRAARRDRLAVKSDLAATSAEQAETGLRDLGAPGADKSGHADNLAGAQRKRHVGERAFRAQPLDAEDFSARAFSSCVRRTASRSAGRPSSNDLGPAQLGCRYAWPRVCHP